MKEDVDVDREGVLGQRIEELEAGECYINCKFIYEPLPPKVLDDIRVMVSDEDGEMLFSDFIDEVKKYMEKHVEHKPITYISGKNTSPVDRLILFELVMENAKREFLKVLGEIENE